MLNSTTKIKTKKLETITTEAKKWCVMAFLQDFRVKEKVWTEFVWGWQFNELSILSSDYCIVEGYDIFALVYVVSCPKSCFVECFEVVCIVKQPEQGYHFFKKIWIVKWEHFSSRKHAVLVHVKEFLYRGLKIHQEYSLYTGLDITRFLFK